MNRWATAAFVMLIGAGCTPAAATVAPVSSVLLTKPPSPTPTVVAAPTSPTFPELGFPVIVGEDVFPNWTPQAAAAEALRRIARTERNIGRILAPAQILEIAVLKGSAVPYAIGNGNLADRPIVWVVKANGTFQAQFGPPGVDRFTASSGFYVFDDTGSPIGSGLPIP